MSFVSYAQNLEDVMLARVLGGVEAGFYIDVGAQDPRIDSVTKAFYDRGWRGINLEPVEAWHQRLCAERPRDINLRVAVGEAEAVVAFHEVVDTGLSTRHEGFARRHQAQGHRIVTGQVRVRTLDAVCAEHGVGLVHFLKVDAEGDEAAVLRGIDLTRLRPWVILVEATEPNARARTHSQWEPLLLGRGYRFAYDDGLNRFYLADEHAGLGDAFATPPNVFDDFTTRELVDYRSHAEGLERHVAALEDLSRLRAEAIGRFEAIVADKERLLANYVADQAQNQASLAALRGLLADREAERDVLAARVAAQDASMAAQDARAAAQDARIAELAARLHGSEQAVATLSHSLLDAQAGQRAAQAGWAESVAAHQSALATLAQAQRDFQEIVASKSWRLTHPLRRMATLLQRLRGVEGRGRTPVAAPAATAGAAATPGGDAGETMAAAVPGTPQRVLAISEDAEDILAHYPVLPERRDDGTAR